MSHEPNQNGTPAAAPPPHAALPPAPAAPIIVRATREEAAGAALKVGGLTIVERAVKQLARMPVPRVILATDGTVAVPARFPTKAEVRRLPADAQTAQALDVALETLRAEVGATSVVAGDVVRVKATDLASGGGLRVVDETTRAQAEDAIFNELLRGDLGLVARHINKRISFRITRYFLCHLPFTPNQVTLGAAAVGLLGCLLIAAGTYPAMIAGLALAQLQSILDGCDGELARVRFQQTAIGEWLDTLVDDGLNLAIIASLGVGLARNGLGWLAIAGGAAAFGMYLFYNVVSYRELIRQGQGGELIKIRWKLAKGRDMKTMVGQAGASGGISGFVLSLGRRDTFVFGWLILAILHLLPLALVWALLTSLSCFVMAVGQVIVRDDPAT